ncbi:thymidylate synthase [Xanthomonas phage vB_Xar_IVIA-DoCa10]|uniref:thymidylate synthase n=1 Tax=Xanthomonas phage vB_Xar_IVIA-DoCa10 TaxID=2975529 RepID=A0A9X9JP02_9CAUD|nr:thymidylate synthase [Xanthomonas phage vB_Xar_IVIA-DoCa10]UYA99043.1 thymidylate synthase [Xanthomonas phage vB_Xar_IVIA-DoCa10]
MTGVLMPFYDTYGALIAWALSSPIEANERTGTRVRVGRGGVAFRVDLSDGLLPTIGFRKTFPKSAAAEVAWYVLGSQDAAFITKYAPLWDKFVEAISYPVYEDDVFIGRSSFKGVKSAYGYRWRRHFGRDQIRLAVEALRKDPSDRRVYVSAWDPAEDGLGEQGQKNVPCPTSFTFSITGGELHSSLFLRSSDLFVGLPYDVMGHALLMDAVAHELGIRPGVMHVSLAHAHLYDAHWDMAGQMLHQDPVLPKLQLPGWKLSQIEQHPDDYVVRYAEEAKQLTWPAFSPKPEVIE